MTDLHEIVFLYSSLHNFAMWMGALSWRNKTGKIYLSSIFLFFFLDHSSLNCGSSVGCLKASAFLYIQSTEFLYRPRKLAITFPVNWTLNFFLGFAPFLCHCMDSCLLSGSCNETHSSPLVTMRSIYSQGCLHRAPKTPCNSRLAPRSEEPWSFVGPILH